MNLHVASSKEGFLEQVTNYIIDNFSGNEHNLKVIMPTGLVCLHLQQLLVQKLGSTILPTILPVSDICAESEEVFKIPSAKIGQVSKIEEKTILAEIIYQYPNLNYSIDQSLVLALSLTNLFFEIEANEIKIHELSNIPALNQAEHWATLYTFINYAYSCWQDRLFELKKSSKAQYQNLMFIAESNRLKISPDNALIIAGLQGSNLMMNKFIQEVSTCANGHVILPPMATVAVNRIFCPEDALYNLSKVLNLIKPKQLKTFSDIKYSILDKLISPISKSVNLTNKLSYIEFDNIFEEASYIASFCKSIIDSKKDTTIAILATTQKAKEQYEIYLNKNNVDYHDLIGIDILKLNVTSFLLIIAEYLCNEFSLQRFFTLISHPYIASKQATDLKMLIIKHNRFANNILVINELVTQHGQEDLQEWFGEFCKPLEAGISNKKFTKIFIEVLKVAQTLIPQIWSKNAQYKIPESLSEIIKSHWDYLISDLSNFPIVLKQLISGGRVYAPKKESNIFLCRPTDAALINFDHIIITDFNEGMMPSQIAHNPWVNKYMQIELGLDFDLAKIGTSLYDIYLNLHNKEVVITRAKKQGGTKTMLPSSFLLRLEYILNDKLEKFKAKSKEFTSPVISMPILNLTNEFQSQTPQGEHTPRLKCKLEVQNSLVDKNLCAVSKIFVSNISVTDVETLIRSPYNFYAKKILRLRQIDKIDDTPKLSEFGTFFHECVHQYTLEYNKIQHDKLNNLIQISQDIVNKSNVPEQTKKIWLLKFSAIAEDFIEFDEDRRKKTVHIYSEIQGAFELFIGNSPINITAIADRIEIDHLGVATILDYKTGAIPTKKDVLAGLSPQLVVEALILLAGGFNIKANAVDKIVYIKINSSKPYITTTEITLTKEDLLEHKAGLINLLEHYNNTKSFPLDQNLMKYDDYTHLARRD